jgi:predicted acyltransferase
VPIHDRNEPLMSSTDAQSHRLISLDQFRGYTVAGMFLVNFLGAFQAAPFLFKHHLVFCSYADTIMPQFFFAVGFSMRLSFSRRAAASGLRAAYWHAVKRCLALALIAVVWYGGAPALPEGMRFEWASFSTIGVWGAVWKQLKVDWFQTLLHIAVVSLWILPVIRASGRVRMGYLCGSATLHLVLNYLFYFAWHNSEPRGIDGGPLGFLTWSIPTLLGTLACDWVTQHRSGERTTGWVARNMLIVSASFCSVGWILSCGTRLYDRTGEVNIDDGTKLPVLSAHPVVPTAESWGRWWGNLSDWKYDRVLAEPPFVPPPHTGDKVVKDGKSKTVNRSSRYRPWNYWMMSQQVGSISYLAFSAGLSLAVFLACFVLCELWGLQLGLFRTLGVNPLIGYFLHSVVEGTVKSFMPKDIAVLGMWIGFGCFFGICWWMLRYLEKKKIFLRL